MVIDWLPGVLMRHHCRRGGGECIAISNVNMTIHRISGLSELLLRAVLGKTKSPLATASVGRTILLSGSPLGNHS
jgi:hypothetical protein